MSKLLALTAILFTAGIAHAGNEAMTCTYTPASHAIENLPLNANTMYVDVESPKSSFMLISPITAESVQQDAIEILKEAQDKMADDKIQVGTLYMFTRTDADLAQLIVQISPIVNGQLTNEDPKEVNFSVPAAGGVATSQVAPGMTCQFAVPAAVVPKPKR